MKKFTPQEKRLYFANLRNRWNNSKKLAETNEIKSIIREVQATGISVSPYSIAFTAMEMKAKKLDGLPVVDCKTFKGWIDSGFRVIKGQKSIIQGITWLKAGKKSKEKENKKDKQSSYVIPKVYNLFHRSQVEAITS